MCTAVESAWPEHCEGFVNVGSLGASRASPQFWSSRCRTSARVLDRGIPEDRHDDIRQRDLRDFRCGVRSTYPAAVGTTFA